MIPALQPLLAFVLTASWQASIIAVIVLTTHYLLRKRLAARWRCAMWGLVLLRLAVPMLPESRLSLYNLKPQTTFAFSIPDQIIVIRPVALPASPMTPVTTSSRLIGAAQKPANLNIYTVLIGLWSAGAAFLLLRTLLITLQFTRQLRKAKPLDDLMCRDELLSCCASVGISNPPPMLESDQVNSPALFGIWRPVLIFPPGLMSRLSSRERQFVLLHELVHLQRRDILVGTFTWLLNTIHWFNPFLWIAASRFRADREMACDARVLALTDSSAQLEYGQIILKLLESLFSQQRQIPGAVAMLETDSSMRRRITQIAQPPSATRRWSLAALLLFLAIAGVTLTRAQSSTTSQALSERTFDIHDLIIYRPDTDLNIFQRIPFGAEARRGVAERKTTISQPTTQQIARFTQQLTDQLIEQIQAAIAPSSWKSNDPAGPSIREASGIITVKQTNANLDQIALLLKDIRTNHATQITVETRFLTGEPVAETVNKLLEGDGSKWERRGDIDVWPVFLDEEQVSEIKRAVQVNLNTTQLTAPRITLFNTQRAWVEVSTSSAYVADIKLDPDGTLNPAVKNVSDGTRIECRAEVRLNKDSVSLALHPKVTKLLKIVAEPWPKPQAMLALPTTQAFIQVPHVAVAEFDQNFDIPATKSLLIRVQPKFDPPDPTAAPEPTVYVLVRPTIIIQKEDNP